MTARFGHTELPDAQAQALRRAIRLERISLGAIAVTITLVLTVAGSSQGMKAAWIEDSLSLLPPLAFLLAARLIRRRPTAAKPYGYHRSIGIAHLVSGVALLVMGLYLIIDSGLGLLEAEHPPIGVLAYSPHIARSRHDSHRPGRSHQRTPPARFCSDSARGRRIRVRNRPRAQ